MLYFPRRSGIFRAIALQSPIHSPTTTGIFPHFARKARLGSTTYRQTDISRVTLVPQGGIQKSKVKSLDFEIFEMVYLFTPCCHRSNKSALFKYSDRCLHPQW